MRVRSYRVFTRIAQWRMFRRWSSARSSGLHFIQVLVASIALIIDIASANAETRNTQVFRCELSTGVVAFSDRYCGDDPQPVYLQAPTSDGLSLGSNGDFSAVTRANAERARKRRTSQLRQQQQALSASHRVAVAALEERLSSLPENAFKAGTAKRLQKQIAALDAEHKDRQRLLLERYRARANE